MAEKFRFTDKRLKGITCEPSGRPARDGKRWVYDAERPGLAYMVTEGGSRSFYLVYKAAVPGRQGKQVRKYRLKGIDTVQQARLTTDSLRAELAKGVDPHAERKSTEQAIMGEATLGTMWADYRRKVVKGERTMLEDAGLWRRYLEPYASTALSSVTAEWVGELYRTVTDGKVDRKLEGRRIRGGKTAGNRMHALLSGMFTECAKKMPNPCRDVARTREVSCKRYLEAVELAAFWKALDKQGETLRDLVKLALFTGQRRWTLLTARWAEINLNFNTWTIPAEKMKGGESHVVPLVPAAVELLKRRKKDAGECEWVFPAGAGESGHFSEPKKGLKAVWTAAGIAPLTLHDLRRTVATWMNSTGASLSTVAALLAHNVPQITGVYMKATADAVRGALGKAVDAMLEAAGETVAKPKKAKTA